MVAYLHVQIAMLAVFCGVAVNEGTPHSLAEEEILESEAINEVKRDVKFIEVKLDQTRAALQELITTLLKASGDGEGGHVIKKRQTSSDNSEDLLSQLPISALLGFRGRDGKDGQNGNDGSPGVNGIPGTNGRDGKDGDDGRDGVPGTDGRDGAKGERGEKGESGPQGLKGAAGEAGVQGEKGADGVPGQAGTPGPFGRDGRDGSKGERGEKGELGENGVPGDDGSNGRDGSKGEHGQKGELGQKGGAGLKGTQGQKGEGGVKGTPGIRGEKGTTGQKGAAANAMGSVYTRWGRITCGNQSSLVYSGFVGGARYDQNGGGVNYQCLPPQPQYSGFSNNPSTSYMAGAEYETSSGIFNSNVNDANVPCARCYTNTRPAVMMIPARTTCYLGWTREYQGYLMTSHNGHPHPTTFECVDADPEYIPNSQSSNNGALFYFVETICSGTGTTHHCPPYISTKQLTCVVCSK